MGHTHFFSWRGGNGCFFCPPVGKDSPSLRLFPPLSLVEYHHCERTCGGSQIDTGRAPERGLRGKDFCLFCRAFFFFPRKLWNLNSPKLVLFLASILSPPPPLPALSAVCKLLLPILINLPKWLFFLILSSGCGVSSNFGICLLRGRLALKPTPKSIFVFQLDLELMLSLSCSLPHVWHQSCKKGRFSSSFVAPGGLILIAPLSFSSSATFGLDSLSLSLSLSLSRVPSEA